MAKYLVTFIVHDPYYDGGVKGIEVFGEICVSCHRDDAVERAVDEYLEQHGKLPAYDETDVEEVKP